MVNPFILFFSGLLIGASLYFFHRRESRKFAALLKDKNARLEQEKKIEALDFYLCGALEIDMEENPDPDGG